MPRLSAVGISGIHAGKDVNRPPIWLPLILLWLATGLSGCSPQEANETTDTKADLRPVDPAFIPAWQHYHNAGVRVLEQLNLCTKKFLEQTQTFLAQPSATGLTGLQEQLKQCHALYLPTLALGSQHNNLQKRLDHLHQRMDTKPIMPGFIDSIEQYPHSGIVNDPSLPLTQQSIEDQHGLTSFSDVSLGFEVIAFLLEGEARYKQDQKPRSVEDFLPRTTWDQDIDLPVSEHPNNRRRRLLEILVMVLHQDGLELTKTWHKDNKPPQLTDQAKLVLNRLTTQSQRLLEDLELPDSTVSALLSFYLNHPASGVHNTPTNETGSLKAAPSEDNLPSASKLPVSEDTHGFALYLKWPDNPNFKHLINDNENAPLRQQALLKLLKQSLL